MAFLGQEDGFIGATEQLYLDVAPAPFEFVDQISIARSAVVTSNTVTVSSINNSIAMTVSAGEYSVNGAGFVSYTTGSATLSVGDTVQLRTTASASYATTVTSTVSINGSTFAQWNVTTIGAPAAVTESNVSGLSADSPLLFSLLGLGPFSGLIRRR